MQSFYEILKNKKLIFGGTGFGSRFISDYLAIIGIYPVFLC